MMCVVIDSYFDEGLAPGLVSVRIPTDDPAWHELRTAPRLGISVLNPLQTIGVANIHHSLTADRDGSALVDGASVHLSTTLYQEFDARAAPCSRWPHRGHCPEQRVPHTAA